VKREKERKNSQAPLQLLSIPRVSFAIFRQGRKVGERKAKRVYANVILYLIVG